jgi:hypothetical protein
MTAVRSLRLLTCPQEVAPASKPSSARRSLRPADRLQPAGQCNTQEARKRDGLALPQSHARGWRCRERMIQAPTLGERPILSTSRRTVQLLSRAGPGPGLHAQLVSPAVHAVRAHAKRYHEYPVYGSRVRCSELDFAEFSWPPQSFPADK